MRTPPGGAVASRSAHLRTAVAPVPAPGETVRFMVSCIGAERYDAAIVRLVNPQSFAEATPFRTEPVATAANGSYAGREQPLADATPDAASAARDDRDATGEVDGQRH